MDTLEIVSRLRRSDVSPDTLDALGLITDRLCSDYPYQPASGLRDEGHAWLRRITGLLDQRLTLVQHREILALAGWMALLVGCVEYDLGERRAAEATRRAALSLGEESGHAEIVGWAYEMQAWYLLTQGDFRGVVAASDAGRACTSVHGVSVQLAAQAAKAWARMGERRPAEAALEEGRALLESLPNPANLDNHFVVDPAKFDFYAMDCYRVLGDDRLAEAYARQVIGIGTHPGGCERQPMRHAEAWVTLGVVAARRGDPEQAAALGLSALDGERRSLPSLLMSSRELATIMRARYGDSAAAGHYLDRLRSLAA
jgi:tetratricopeptide (TPR) repeat protein